MDLQRGEVAAEVAAGVYFEERRGLVGALHRLLQVQALPGPEPSQEISAVIAQFNDGLLSLRANGRSLLVSRLIELIGVSVPYYLLTKYQGKFRLSCNGILLTSVRE